MLEELSPEDYRCAEPLLRPFDYSVSLQAALVGDSPARIFVDDARRPRAAFALTVEGYFLAGDSQDPEVRQAFRDFMQDCVFTGQILIRVDSWMSLAVHPARWEALLPEIIPTHEAEIVPRYHYLCSQACPASLAEVPAGYALHPLAAILRGEVAAEIPEALTDETQLEAYYGSAANFVTRGAGFAVVREGQVVSWCRSNCAASGRIELGVATMPEHRQRGLATAAAAATVGECFARGWSAVSWQCDGDNIASWKTAEKLGFQKAAEYCYYCYVYDLGGQLAQLGWRAFRSGDFAKCVGYYARAFPMQARPAPSDLYYAAAASAALGDRASALRRLGEAAAAGWRSVERTLQTPGFASLFTAEDWAGILEKMREPVEAKP